jgi:pilus assembly protein CpaE
VDSQKAASDTGPLRAVLISTDPAFRDQVRGVVSQLKSPIEMSCVIEVAFTRIADPELGELRRSDAQLAIVDLESDPHIGLKFIQFLMEARIATAVMAAGRNLTSDLLLRALQAGVMEIVQKPASAADLEGALDRINKKTGHKAGEGPDGKPAKAIALFAAKGGQGTTSLAVNLAIEIHRLTRQKVLLLDLDLELGETALLLGADPQFSLVDLIRNMHRVDQNLLASYIEHHTSGIDLLAAPFQPADYETVSRDRIRQVVSFLKAQYDWVVMDTPKSFHPASIGVLEEADETLLIINPTLPAIRNMSRSLPLVNQLASSSGQRPLRLIVNRYGADELISIAEIADTVGVEVYHTIRNDFKALMESTNEGRPIVLRGNSHYAKDVRALAAKLTGVPAGESKSGIGLLQGLVGAFRNGRE